MTFLDEVRKKLDLPPAEKEQVMRELESHYHEVEDEALNAGMNECEAAIEAAKRLGDPSDIAQRMQTDHTRATWKTALLTALPFLVYAFLEALLPYWNKSHIPGSSLIFLAGISLVIFSIHEVNSNRRPLWLATWLPMGIWILSDLLSTATKSFNSFSVYYSMAGQVESQKGVIEWLMWSAIPIFFVGSLALYASWRSVKWGLLIIGVITLGLSLQLLLTQTDITNNSLASGYHMAYEVYRFIYGITSLLLAIRLFLRHPYGNKLKTSLMTYTFLILWQLPIINIRFGKWTTLDYGLIISGMAILLLARASQWQIKQSILFLITIILGLAGIIATLLIPNAPPLDIQYVKISALFTAINVILIIFTPELIDRHYKKHKPELAR